MTILGLHVSNDWCHHRWSNWVHEKEAFKRFCGHNYKWHIITKQQVSMVRGLQKQPPDCLVQNNIVPCFLGSCFPSSWVHNGLNENWAGEARQGTGSQLNELGYWRPERVLSHSWVNWGRGGQTGYSVMAEWTGAVEARESTGSQLSELGQEWPERVLVHSWVNWGGGGQSRPTELGQWRQTVYQSIFVNVR